jgi:hypothetical protein
MHAWAVNWSVENFDLSMLLQFAGEDLLVASIPNYRRATVAGQLSNHAFDRSLMTTQLQKALIFRHWFKDITTVSCTT